MAADKIDTIVSLSKRRGFVYPCSEIYGGTRAAWCTSALRGACAAAHVAARGSIASSTASSVRAASACVNAARAAGSGAALVRARVARRRVVEAVVVLVSDLTRICDAHRAEKRENRGGDASPHFP